MSDFAKAVKTKLVEDLYAKYGGQILSYDQIVLPGEAISKLQSEAKSVFAPAVREGCPGYEANLAHATFVGFYDNDGVHQVRIYWAEKEKQQLLFPEIDTAFMVDIEPQQDFDELMATLDHIVVEEINVPAESFKDMPNPTEDDLKSPVFNALWNVVKTWDVNAPLYYAGYCGATGSHVKLLLDALQPFLKEAHQPVKLPRF